jgi:hypothetical protein
MDRITLHHRTAAVNLPLIEVDGLRTRVDLSDRLGPVGAFDAAATGRLARGRRVSGWVAPEQAAGRRGELGPGRIVFSVDPRRAVANRAADREADPVAVWERVRPLAAWLAEVDGDVARLPDDLEVHQEVPVRAKLLRIAAPDLTPDELGVYAGVVAAVADQDRVAAKLLMHLALAGADGDGAIPRTWRPARSPGVTNRTHRTSACASRVPTPRRSSRPCSSSWRTSHRRAHARCCARCSSRCAARRTRPTRISAS